MDCEPRVDLFGIEGLPHLPDGHFHEPDLGQGFLCAALGQEVGHARLGEPVGQCDSQVAAVAKLGCFSSCTYAAEEGQQSLGVFTKHLSRPSQSCASLSALEQRYAELRF